MSRYLPYLFALLLFLYGCGGGADNSAVMRAESLLSHGDYRGALELYASFADQHPESELAPQSQYMVGYIFNHHLSMPEAALDAYAMVISLYPDSLYSIKAREDRAAIYAARGDHRAAIREYDWLLHHGQAEKSREYRYRIALEYIKINEFGQARAEFARLLEGADSNSTPQILYQIANTHMLEGNLKDAIDIYNRIIEEYGDNPLSIEARLSKAVALEKAGSLREALGLLTELKEEYPDSDTLNIRINSTIKRLKKAPALKYR